MYEHIMDTHTHMNRRNEKHAFESNSPIDSACVSRCVVVARWCVQAQGNVRRDVMEVQMCVVVVVSTLHGTRAVQCCCGC